MSASASRFRPSVAGVLLAVLIGVAYAGAWSPARDWIGAHAVAPVLQSVAEASESSYRVRSGGGSTVVIIDTSSSFKTGFQMTGGVRFLLPGLILALLFPKRRYWLGLFGYHLFFEILILASASAGIAFGRWGFAVANVLDYYVLSATSFGFVVVVLAPESPFELARHNASSKGVSGSRVENGSRG